MYLRDGAGTVVIGGLQSTLLRVCSPPVALTVAGIFAAAAAVEMEAAEPSTTPRVGGSTGVQTVETTPVEDVVTSVVGPLQKRLRQAFRGSFSQGVDLFFDAGEGWVSPEVFEWWAFRVDPVGLTPEGAERMFARISTRTPVFPGPRTGTTCAVVGASRNLLGARQGVLIDDHDVVIRVNRAPTAEFAVDVGTKTTHHVMWPTNLGEDQADRRAFLLVNPMTLHTPHLFDRILSLVENDLGWETRRVRIIHPGFVMYLHQNWMGARGGFPSTGFIALMMAVHLCDEVDVFGFGADAQGRWDRYYEDDPAVPTDLHPAAFEGRFREELEARGIVTVHRGNRSRVGADSSGP